MHVNTLKKQVFLYIALFSLVAAAFLSSCGPLSSDEASNESKLNHDLNAPVLDQAAWNWGRLSSEEHEEFGVNRYVENGFLDSDHILTRRTAYWVDKLDAMIRASNPSAMRNVPKPDVKIITKDVFNGFITGFFTCYELPIEIAGREGTTDNGLYVDLGLKGELTRWKSQDEDFAFPCIKSTNTSEIISILEKLNARGDSSCQFEVVGAKIVASGTCPLADDMAGIAGGNTIVTQRTSSWVNIFSGLIQEIDQEEKYVSILAHELGHYYRSHITSFAGDYGFYYMMAAENPKARPIPSTEERIIEYGQLTYDASEIVFNDMYLVDIENDSAEITSRAYLAAGDLARQLCEVNSIHCSTSCKAVVALQTDADYKAKMGIYPLMRPPTAVATYLNRYEKNVKACLSPIKFGPTAGITKEMLETALNTPRWFGVEDEQEFFRQGLRGLLREIISTFFNRVKGLPENSDDAFVLVKAIGGFLKEQLASSIQTIRAANQAGLGQYTAEQEADELAGEWLAEIGISPKAVVEASLLMAKNDRDLGIQIGGKECRKLYNAGWKNEQGEAILVPLGNYAEVHHSSCFRAYNADREISAHDYVVAPLETPSSLPGGSWSDIRAAATRSHQGLESNSETSSELDSGLGLKSHINCRFSEIHKH